MSNADLQQQVADSVIKSLTPVEQKQLLLWAQDLQDIRNSELTIFAKGKKALAITRDRQALAPVAKLLLRELRRVGWDDRTWVGKLGISGSLISLLILNTATGGFAAFGTAIAVPLWMVVGSGGVLLGVLIETLKRLQAEKNRIKAANNSFKQKPPCGSA